MCQLSQGSVHIHTFKTFDYHISIFQTLRIKQFACDNRVEGSDYLN